MPKWILNIIEAWMVAKKTGYIQINFFKGGITSINRNDTIKKQ